MTAVLGAAGSVALAALLAVTSAVSTGPALPAAAVAVVVLALAAGWGVLLDLPDPRGTGVVIAVTGLAAAVASVVSQGRTRPLAAFAAVLALGVLLAFGHELVRRGGRAALVESVTGTFSGQVLAVLAAGWALLPGTRVGLDGVLVAAAAVAAARLSTAVPGPARVTGWVGVAAGAVAALVVGYVVMPQLLGAAAAIGLGIAGVTAGLDRLLAAQDAAQDPAALVASAAAPVAAAGTVAYAVARLLVP